MSLTQLLAALAILGVLLALALPSFTRQRLRTVRQQGEGCLLQVLKLEEEYYTRSNSQYMTNNSNLTSSSSLPVGNQYCAETLGGPSTSAEQAGAPYVISVTTAPTNVCATASQAFCYCVIANPQGAQIQDGVLALIVNSTLPDPGLRVRKVRFNTLTSSSSCPDPTATTNKPWADP